MSKRIVHRHGLTLIELVLSLGLLAAVFGVSVSWITLSGRQAAIATGPLRWEAHAQAALRCLEDDLLLGDFEIGGGDAERLARRQARVQAGENRLAIHGRGMGGAGDMDGRANTSIYRVEGGFLVRGVGAHTAARRLVPVARFDATIEGEHEFITIALVSDGGRTLTRRYRLP